MMPSGDLTTRSPVDSPAVVSASISQSRSVSRRLASHSPRRPLSRICLPATLKAPHVNFSSRRLPQAFFLQIGQVLAQGAAVAPIFRVSHRLRPSGRVSSARTPAYPYFCSGCVQPNDGKPPEFRPRQVLEVRVQRNVPRRRGRLDRIVAFFKRYLLVRFPMDSGGDTDSGRSVYWYSGVNIIRSEERRVGKECRSR